jgi:soluble lytic murein transglycosylase
LKKFIVFFLIVAVSVGIGFGAQTFEDYMIKKKHPLKYSEYVDKYSEEFEIPKTLLYSVIKCESGFDPKAKSRVGARGLMQLMPDTYGWLLKMRHDEAGDIFDPEENIKYGTYYLSVLYKKYKNWTYALCAYNAGMGNVDKWLSGESFSIPFAETKEYVNKLDVVMDKYLGLYYG